MVESETEYSQQIGDYYPIRNKKANIESEKILAMHNPIKDFNSEYVKNYKTITKL